MEKSKSTHGGAGRGQGRKPLPVKQKSYSFRCYPSQMDAIRKLIKEYKDNDIFPRIEEWR
jgi:hypothetical protein